MEPMLSLRPELPRVSAQRVERLALVLERALGPSKVLSSREACEAHARDESEALPAGPDLVVLATSAEDISTTLRLANEHEVPVTPRGAGSGRTGGAVPVAGGVVLALQGMNDILEINRADQLAVVRPGVILADLRARVEEEGLFYPPDPSSAAYCSLGGNLAENAGGPRAFKYGVTRHYVLGLEAALMDGTRLRVGARTVKNVTGYDLTSLFVGSEGTLGVLTEITLRLIPKPPTVMTLLGLFEHVDGAASAVSRMVEQGLTPRCLELLDATTLQALRHKGVGIDERAGALLLIETDGEPESCEREAQRLGEACDEAGAQSVEVAQSGPRRERLWLARKEMSRAVRALASVRACWG